MFTLYIDFTGILLKRIEHLLGDSSDWAIKAALNHHSLQANYTLINSIKKSLDTQIQQALMYIISQIDMNSNLELLRHDDACLRKLWLLLFDNINFLPLAGTITPPVEANYIRNHVSEFPFSRELIGQVNVTIDHRSIVTEGITTLYANFSITIHF